jgi:hypothetical protein
MVCPGPVTARGMHQHLATCDAPWLGASALRQAQCEVLAGGADRRSARKDYEILLTGCQSRLGFKAPEAVSAALPSVNQATAGKAYT